MPNLGTNAELDAFRQTIKKEVENRIKWAKQYGNASQQNNSDSNRLAKTLSEEEKKNASKRKKKPAYEKEKLDLEEYMDREKPISGLSGRFAGHFMPDYKNQFKTTSSDVYKQLEMEQNEMNHQHKKRKYWLKTYFENQAKAKLLEKKKAEGS